MSVEDAIAHLTEAKAAEVRGHLMASLLARPGVWDFITTYDDDPEPDRVAEAASDAGLVLDEIDTARGDSSRDRSGGR